MVTLDSPFCRRTIFCVMVLVFGTVSLHPPVVAEQRYGELPTTEYRNRTIHPGFECLCGCSDQHGYVYVGSNCGVFRFDGSQWIRATPTPSSNICINDGGLIYGAGESGVFRMAASPVNPPKTVHLNEQLVEAGIPAHRVSDFSDISAVGGDVFAVQAWSIARISPVGVDSEKRPADGGANDHFADQIRVIHKRDHLPKNLVFQRVINLDGRPLALLTSNVVHDRTQFAWIDDANRLIFIPEMQVESLICDVTRVNEHEVLGVSEDKVYQVTAGSVKDITPAEISGNMKDFQRIIVFSQRHYAILSSRRGIFVVDKVLGQQFANNRNLPVAYPARPFTGGFFADHLGRMWIGGSMKLSCVDVLSGEYAWYTPNHEPITSLEIHGKSIVLTTANSVYAGLLSYRNRGTPCLINLQPVPLPKELRDWQQPRVSFAKGVFMIVDRKGVYQLYPDQIHDQPRGTSITIDPPHWICSLQVGKEHHARVVASPQHQTAYIVASNLSHPVVNLRYNDRFSPLGWFRASSKRWDPADGAVKQATLDNKGNLWVSIENYELGSYVAKLSSARSEPTTKFMIDGVPYAFEENLFVFRPSSCTVLRYQPDSEQFVPDDEFNRLLNSREPMHGLNLTRQICRDANGHLLFGTSTENCLEVLRDGEKLEAHPITMFDADSHRQIREIDQYGNTWAVAENRIDAYDKRLFGDQIRKLGTESVHISRVSLSQLGVESAASTSQESGSESELAGNEIYLPVELISRDKHHTQFRFSTGALTIDYAFPLAYSSNEIEYSTRMVGLVDEWSSPSLESYQRFPALPPGHYQFQVRVCLPQEEELPITMLDIDVLPAWYQSRLFYAATASMLAIIVISMVIYRIASDRKHLKRLRDEVRDRKAVEQRLRDSQQELMQRERLRTLGVMAAGVAHDVNNMLSPICMYAEMLQSNLDLQPDDVREMASSIAQCALDSSDIIRKLSPLHTFRPQDASTFELAAVVEEVINNASSRMYHPDCTKRITFRNEVDAISLTCFESDVREALTNLVINSIDAIEMQGNITVRGTEKNDNVQIEVVDDGIGMSDDVRRLCCDTFFTTKGKLGSGLGLAMTRAIVAGCNAKMEIQSEEGKGTCVCITMPTTICGDANLPTPSVGRHELPPCRILVVEDNQTTRQSLVLILDSMGHEVRCAESPQALKCLERESFDVLLTDYRMPNLDGFELCRSVKEKLPHVARIIMSGYEEMGIREHCHAFVQKPISTDVLNRAMRQALHLAQTMSQQIESNS